MGPGSSLEAESKYEEVKFSRQIEKTDIRGELSRSVDAPATSICQQKQTRMRRAVFIEPAFERKKVIGKKRKQAYNVRGGEKNHA